MRDPRTRGHGSRVVSLPVTIEAMAEHLVRLAKAGARAWPPPGPGWRAGGGGGYVKTVPFTRRIRFTVTMSLVDGIPTARICMRHGDAVLVEHAVSFPPGGQARVTRAVVWGAPSTSAFDGLAEQFDFLLNSEEIGAGWDVPEIY